MILTCIVCGRGFDWERGPKGGGQPRCCSPECRKERQRQNVRDARANVGGCPPDKHGITGYTYYGCDCPVCLRAMAEAKARSRKRLKARGNAT